MTPTRFFYVTSKWLTVLMVGVLLGCILNDLGLSVIVSAWAIIVVGLFISLLFDYQESEK